MFLKKYHFLIFTFCFCFIKVSANEFCEDNFPPVVSNTCIGDSGKVELFIFNNIDGYELDGLFHDPSFPQNPDQVKDLSFIASPILYNDFYGGMIRGLIRAPETGDYIFNITYLIDF